MLWSHLVVKCNTLLLASSWRSAQQSPEAALSNSWFHIRDGFYSLVQSWLYYKLLLYINSLQESRNIFHQKRYLQNRSLAVISILLTFQSLRLSKNPIWYIWQQESDKSSLPPPDCHTEDSNWFWKLFSKHNWNVRQAGNTQRSKKISLQQCNMIPCKTDGNALKCTGRLQKQEQLSLRSVYELEVN